MGVDGTIFNTVHPGVTLFTTRVVHPTGDDSWHPPSMSFPFPWGCESSQLPPSNDPRIQGPRPGQGRRPTPALGRDEFVAGDDAIMVGIDGRKGRIQ